MGFSTYFDLIVGQLWFSLRIAFFPTLKAICKSPSLLLRPRDISRIVMAQVWKPFGNGLDENGRSVKQSLIPPNARGVVLDIGAGHGHTALYLDPAKVTKYVALEPNQLMHPEIRSRAATRGFSEASGNCLILPYGAEETALITSALGGLHQVDTLISVLTICSIPDPERSLAALVDEVLKPGGTFVFYEHVLSHRADVAWWQRFWTPVWKLEFDGCRLDRPTHKWVQNLDAWEEGSVWTPEDENEEQLFWHQAGRFIKKTA
ncbi:S-adenosyl-L-methionine-dependent methyltransferase [Cubamyces menziesii]|uniref:S-adenosyl-L-methionine-dependent methyltransferase n=1 Tax=Trametes cubensis TaxID=1111947 RepID=A0AAD7XG67_9APHY|nr:S-adenosyl-L-methionine-dependent methyltransferase [Cubamyces menziesii]KAJ8497079.1 hypothetical protein ONZ51_g727 [Trametes cubensis]